MNEELKPCPFCGKVINKEKELYLPERDWKPSYYDPDSGGYPISISCKCGLEFSTGTYEWEEFVRAWNTRCSDERTKAIQEFYDKSADALMWLLYEYGEDLYLEVGNTLRSVKEQMEGT